MFVSHDPPQNAMNELLPEYWVQVIAKGMNMKMMSMSNLRAEEFRFGMFGTY